MLLMEWIEEDIKGKIFWESLGRGLAEVHRANSGETYGFETDNFIGRLPQRNKLHADWVEFFTNERILPQVEMARRAGRWSDAWDEGLSGLLDRLPSLLPARPHASLVHGDLWAGNVLAARGGRAAVVDPAVYRGHREVDLAMSELFGGFSPVFLEAYQSEWKLESGYRDRRDVYNLYHLINHLNHFGSSYAGQVAAVLKRFA
jgi:fructosamine-3-kinase